MHTTLDRRACLATLGAGLTRAVTPAAVAPRRPRVAAIYTVFYRRSHAFNIIENFLEPHLFNGRRTDSGMEVVSFYADQFVPRGDLTRGIARNYGIPLYDSIEGALCRGGRELAVDAVLSIGEHGEYPLTPRGLQQYPRKQFFDDCVAVFRRSGRAVPVFNDKHLSYRWDWAKEMVETARKLRFSLMAGSSVPLAQRLPPLELPANCRIEEAVSIHGGPFERYDFHALEVLQSLVEARAGGETGVIEVRFVPGAQLLDAAQRGDWSLELADAAMAAELGEGQPSLRQILRFRPFLESGPHGILIRYRDGLRGTVLKIGTSSIRWNFACRLRGEKRPRTTRFHVGPWGNRNLFMALSHAIQHLFRTGRSPYPIERTLLTTGIVGAAADSRAAGGKSLATAHLSGRYAPVDWRTFREMGASWKALAGVPEPEGIGPSGSRR